MFLSNLQFDSPQKLAKEMNKTQIGSILNDEDPRRTLIMFLTNLKFDSPLKLAEEMNKTQIHQF